MKLGITLIILGFLAWCWFLSTVSHPLSIGRWIAAVFLLYCFVGPGIHVLVDPESRN